MKKKEKGINKKIIIIIICVIILMLAVVAVVNYIILPPKISENAIKYKYCGYNYMHLKSIIDDGDNVIIEFGSLNKNFNYFFNQKKLKTSQDDQLLSTKEQGFVEWYGSFDSYSNMACNPNYYIISTLTSNYLVIEKSPEMKMADLYKYLYIMQYKDVEIQLRFFENYENATLFMSINHRKDNKIDSIVQKKQTYNSYDKTWNSLEKYTIYEGSTITNAE